MPKGAKFGGRVKGTPNKSSLMVRDILDKGGLNLVEEIQKLIPLLTPDERVKALVSLMPYVYPKLAQLEVKATLEDSRKLEDATDEQLDAILSEARKI